MALEEYSADIPLRWVVVPTIGSVKMDVPRGRKKQQSLENFDRFGTEIYGGLKAAGVGDGALAGVSWGGSRGALARRAEVCRSDLAKCCHSVGLRRHIAVLLGTRRSCAGGVPVARDTPLRFRLVLCLRVLKQERLAHVKKCRGRHDQHGFSPGSVIQVIGVDVHAIGSLAGEAEDESSAVHGSLDLSVPFQEGEPEGVWASVIGS